MKGKTMAKKKIDLPEIGGLRPNERKAITFRAELDVPEIVEQVKELYAQGGKRITNDTIYAEAMRRYWGEIVEGRRPAE